jgi:hypothetical protein
MVIERTQYLDPEHIDFAPVIPSTTADQLIDELAPPNERGKANKWLNPESFVVGGSSLIKQEYENISVTFYGTTEGSRLITLVWLKRPCSSADQTRK